MNAIQNLTYEYDGVGNVTKITDGVSGEVKNFTYDALNRLIQADGNYGANQSSALLTFEYYPNGNIKTKDGLNYTYDPARIKPHAVRSVGTDTFDYDANGNLWKKTSSGVTTTYTFNTENQLTNISSTGSDFAYDDTGERIKKTFAGTITRFVGDLYETNGSTAKEYVFVGGMRVASVTGNAVSFTHADHLGGTNVVTSSTGAVIDRADYKPFGEFKQHIAGSNEGYFFTDQYNDSESGLYYYGARYYNPMVGRFISPDWIVPGGTNTQAFNRYAYVLNNPLNFIDPSGNAPGAYNGFNQFTLGSSSDSFNLGSLTRNSSSDNISLFSGGFGSQQLLGSNLGFSASSTDNIQIISEIRPPHSQAGVKSTQNINVDLTTKTLNSNFSTGKTKFAGMEFSSRDDNFNVSEQIITNNFYAFSANGTTGSRLYPFGNIDYQFDFNVDKNAGNANVKGSHDGFPSYIINFNGQKVYDYQQNLIRQLFGDADDVFPNFQFNTN